MLGKKLERPPYVHNWVRYNYPDFKKTTKEMVAFAKCVPQVTYAAGSKIIYDRIAMGLSRETAKKAALSHGHKKSRPYVSEFVDAFYDYDEVRQFSGLPSFDQFVEPYLVSRTVRIPVKPLIVIAENGLLKPIFVVGWASMPLDRFQRRLLMTVIEDAVFSLTDFQNSSGEFVSFPKNGKGPLAKREPEIWHRGDFELLSDQEIREQMSIYLKSLEAAKVVLSQEINPSQENSTSEQASLETTNQDDLFEGG